MFQFQGTKCPNCGFFKVEERSTVRILCLCIAASAIFIITLPLEIVLVPITIIAAFMPSQRKLYHFCRNCKWSDKTQGTTTPTT